MPAYYRSELVDFVDDDSLAVVGALTSKHQQDGFFSMILALPASWQHEIEILKKAGRELIATYADAKNWSLLLEYPIPRRQRRIDCVMLARGLVVVLEFKIGSSTFETAAKQQVEDYCLDLRDFHSACRDLRIAPLLVASDAQEMIAPAEISDDQVTAPHCCGASQLSTCVGSIVNLYGREHASIPAADWDDGLFSPTPTIIEAAQTLYHLHRVSDITRSGAGETDLRVTTTKIVSIIGAAKKRGSKVICFVTGVPGSGKTLVGLNLVHHPDLMTHDQGIASFMSGNIPLINVLREALARNIHERLDLPRGVARRKMNHTIQNIHSFTRDMYEDHQERPPKDKVIIYDEAQRAWSANKNESKYSIPHSEPSMILDVMGRHQGWCVLVCLVGPGQEIHDGEAGLEEWARSLATRDEWNIHVATDLAAQFTQSPNIQAESHLHLDTTQRSFKAQSLAKWIDSVLDNNPKSAQVIASEMDDFSIKLTRSLDSTRAWLARTTRGLRRCGLVASSGAKRLRAHGVDVSTKIDEVPWFLNPQGDVRSSYCMEVPATEFSVQGLELDIVGLCWGADLRRCNNSWDCYEFEGTEWGRVSDKRMDRRKFIFNKYRVLLSRAREGIVIWVPPGDQSDQTRLPTLYNATAEYLLRCGVRPMP